MSRDGTSRTPSPSYVSEDLSGIRGKFSELEDENRNLRGTAEKLEKAEAEYFKLVCITVLVLCACSWVLKLLLNMFVYMYQNI